MFVKHCKVEVYLTELKLCKDSNMDNVITRRFSKVDTIGEESIHQQSIHLVYTFRRSHSSRRFLFNTVSRGEVPRRKV